VTPQVLNRRQFPGRLPPNTKLIDRTTIWGNPWHVGADGTRDYVCDRYEAWIVTQPLLMAKLHNLRGLHLMCHCAPKRCHGLTLRRLANPEMVFECEAADQRSPAPGPV
jgi:hypothetical protein